MTVSFAVDGLQPTDQGDLKVRVIANRHVIYTQQVASSPQPMTISFTVPADAKPDWTFALKVKKAYATIPLTILPVGTPGDLPEVPYPVLLPALLLLAIPAARWVGKRRRAAQ